jgi:uncharacterized membrane protein
MKDILTNGVLIAIVAHGLIGISLIWDKILLKRKETRNVVSYVFWLGAMSVLGLCLIPFGFTWPPLWLAGIAFASGVIHLISNFFYFAALKLGEASDTLAIMGGFSPLATFLIGIPLLNQHFTALNAWGLALMVAGGFFMFFSERMQVGRILTFTVLAAGFFGLTGVTQKLAFNQTNFVTAYVFFTLGTFACALAFLLRPAWRRQIFQKSEHASPRSKAWYFANRFLSGVGSFLIFFAISKANPAIVDAISGVRYVLIFTGAFLLTKYRPKLLCEQFTGWALTAKSIATALVVAGLVLVGLEGTGGGSSPSASMDWPHLKAVLLRNP